MNDWYLNFQPVKSINEHHSYITKKKKNSPNFKVPLPF